MACVECGDEEFEIYANESVIAPLCERHKDSLNGISKVEMKTTECKRCNYVARCCRTKLKGEIE